MSAPTRTKYYNVAACLVQLGPFTGSGYADEDDVLELEEADDLFEITVGVDGETAASLKHNRNVNATLRLMETGRLHFLLEDYLIKLRAALDLGGSLPPMPFAIVKPSGKTLTGDQVIFRRFPNEGIRRYAGTVEYPITLVNPKRTASIANSI